VNEPWDNIPVGSSRTSRIAVLQPPCGTGHEKSQQTAALGKLAAELSGKTALGDVFSKTEWYAPQEKLPSY
jgi:hypothetical protein